MGRYSVGITGVYKNPNYLVSFLNIVLLIILYVLFLKKTKLLFTLLLVLVTILFVNAFYLSGARAAFLTMAFSILFVLLELVKTKRTNSVATLFVIGCLVLFVITFSYQGIMNRADMFIGNRSFTEDEGRSFSWIIAMNHWKESPVWGCGSESWSSIANSSSGMIWLHNIFLELLLNQGLIGVLLLILLVFSGYNKTKKEDRLFLIALVTVSAFPLFFQNGLWEMNFWRFILINRIAFNYSRYSKKGVLAAIIS
jgi:O-antigen ligase